jgi:hypothetical protein
MNISFPVEQQPNQILVVVAGETSMQEMMGFITENRTGERREYAFLFDVSAATVTLTAGEMQGLAAYAAAEASKGPIGPLAFISTNPAVFGMGRMFQAYSDAEGRRNVGVFRTLADAQVWVASLKEP